MTIVRCPRCRDEVTVPPKAGSRALVRCPLCLEEYLLAEALANAPPALVIIGGEVPQSAIEPIAQAADEYQLAGGSFAGMSETAGAAAGGAAAATALPRPLPRGTTRLTRPRRRQTSGLFLLANYVGGGVVGLALGLLVLWWGFHRDPLNAGPGVAAYAPWIVPAEFRGKMAAPEAVEPARGPIVISRDGGASAGKKRRPRERALPQGEKASEEELQTLPPLEAPTPSVVAPAVEAPVLRSIEPPALEDINTRSAEPVQPERAEKASHTDEATKEDRVEPDLRGLLPDDWPSTAAAPTRPMPLVAPEEVEKAVADTKSALTNYEAAPPANADARADAVSDFHGAAGEAGRLLSYRRPDESEFAQGLTQFAELLETAAKKPALLTSLEALTAERWPELPDGYGLLAVGTVQSQAPVGQLYEMKLESRGKDGRVTLYVTTAADPRDICSDGDRILVAGRVVEEPQINLPGYQDKEAKVLSAGYLYAVPR